MKHVLVALSVVGLVSAGAISTTDYYPVAWLLAAISATGVGVLTTVDN